MPNRKSKILIVDDLATNIQVVMNLLQKENYELFFATNYKEAFYLIENELFNLILLDIMMPEMDGFEICKILKSKKSTKNIPIIFLTAKTEPKDIARGFEVGAVDYITKPFNKIELLARIKTQLSLQKAQIEKEKILLTKATLQAKSEMINMIAHQWRQPLNTLSLIIQDLEFNCQKEKINPEHISYQTSKGISVIQYLSKIISEFSDFFIPKQDKEMISIKEILDGAMLSIERELKSLNISIDIEINFNDKFYTYKNELTKVILNIVKNAKEELIKKESNRKIKIIVYKNKKLNLLIIEIIDNGGGIKEEIADKIFEPYFSTKSMNGTGLGLYISKIVVTKYIKGSLRVENIENENGKGTKFTIKFPI